MCASRFEPLESRRLFNAVSGTVFNDRNNNGSYDGAGPDIPQGGVTVYVDSNNNGQLDTGETSAVSAGLTSGMAGQYRLDGLGVDTYHIRVVPPVHYAQTFPVNGADHVVTFTSGPNLITFRDFGVRDLTQSSRLGGRAYSDPNVNGVRDAGETALQNVTVWVDLDNDGAMESGEPSTVTDSTGFFRLDPLNPNYTATYYVRAIAPSGLNQTAPASNGAWVVTIDAGNATTINDIFGFADLTPPTVVASRIMYEARPHVIRFDLSEPNANQSFTVAFALTVTRLADNTNYAPGSFTLQQNSGGVLTYAASTSTFPNGQIPDGNYRARLAGSTLKDAAGNTQTNAYSFDFFLLSGDANHDRVVDTLDFNALAANFGKTSVNYAQADFNYDNVVDTLDFNTLASQFGKSLVPAATVARTVFSPRHVSTRTVEADLDDALHLL